MKIHKVFFTNLNQTTDNLGISDINSISSLNKVASQLISAASSYTSSTPKVGENGIADVDMKKRKITWTITNFKGQTNKTLEVNFTYDKDVIIDEF